MAVLDVEVAETFRLHPVSGRLLRVRQHKRPLLRFGRCPHRHQPAHMVLLPSMALHKKYPLQRFRTLILTAALAPVTSAQ